MGELADAFAELRGEFDSLLSDDPANPKRQTIRIAGKEVPAIVEDVTFDALVTAGGEGDQGGFAAQVGIDSLPNRPKEGTEVTARGQTCEILTVANINGVVWLITCGFIAAE